MGEMECGSFDEGLLMNDGDGDGTFFSPMEVMELFSFLDVCVCVWVFWLFIPGPSWTLLFAFGGVWATLGKDGGTI